jgi:hypothetical protein
MLALVVTLDTGTLWARPMIKGVMTLLQEKHQMLSCSMKGQVKADCLGDCNWQDILDCVDPYLNITL